MRYALKPELKAVASQGLLERGGVSLIGLDAIKAQSGARWGKLRGSVAAHLEGLLRQKLGPADFFIELDDTTFLVSMPSAVPEASQIFCLRIAHELQTNMLGRCELGQLCVARGMRWQDGELVAAAIGGGDLIQLAVKAGLDGLVKTSPPAADRPVAVRPVRPEFFHRYLPLWDAPREAITTYRCVTAPYAGGGVFKTELNATLSRLAHAAHALTERLRRDERILVSVPIAYDMLTAPAGRMEIASACRALAATLRPYLIFEIGELPQGVPQSRMADLVCTLKPFSRAVGALLPLPLSSHGDYRSAGLGAIGISLGPVAGSDMESEIEKLCAAAKRQHLLSFVLDAPDAPAVAASRRHGVNLVSSPLIGTLMPAPAPVTRFAALGIIPQSSKFIMA